MARTRSQAVALTIATTTQTRSRTRALGSAAVFSSLRPITRAAAQPPIQATKAAKRSKSHHRAPKLRSSIKNSPSPDSAVQQSASRYRSASSPEAIDQLHANTSSSSSSPNPAPKHAVSVPSNSSSSSESLATPQQFSPNRSNDQPRLSSEELLPPSEIANQQQQPLSTALSSSAKSAIPAFSPGYLSSQASLLEQLSQPTFNFGIGQTLPVRRNDDDARCRTLAGWRYLGHQKLKGVVKPHHGPGFQAPRRVINTHRDLTKALARAVKPDYRLQRKEEQYFRIHHEPIYWLRRCTMVKKWDEDIKRNRRILATRNLARKLGCGTEMWKVCQVEQSSGLGVEVGWNHEKDLIDPALHNL